MFVLLYSVVYRCFRPCTEMQWGYSEHLITLYLDYLPLCSLRAPRCPCLDPAVGKAWRTAATRITGEKEMAPVMACRTTLSSPPLSAAPRGNRTNLVSLASQGQIFKHCKPQGQQQFVQCVNSLRNSSEKSNRMPSHMKELISLRWKGLIFKLDFVFNELQA